MNDSPLTLDSVVSVKSDVLSSTIDGELVMVDIAQGSYFGLDPVGARIWALMAEPTSLESVCSTLQGEFTVDPQTCRSEVLAFAHQLLDAQLLTVV